MRSKGHGTPEPSEPSWLFQKGNTLGKWPRKPRRMERFIRKVTQDDDIICAFFLAVASGQPIPVRYVEPLPRSEEQLAVARGHATPEQKAKAKKQRRFVVVKRPYYPTMEDLMEAKHWLSDRGFGKAPKRVTIANTTNGPPARSPASGGEASTRPTPSRRWRRCPRGSSARPRTWGWRRRRARRATRTAATAVTDADTSFTL